MAVYLRVEASSALWVGSDWGTSSKRGLSKWQTCSISRALLSVLWSARRSRQFSDIYRAYSDVWLNWCRLQLLWCAVYQFLAAYSPDVYSRFVCLQSLLDASLLFRTFSVISIVRTASSRGFHAVWTTGISAPLIHERLTVISSISEAEDSIDVYRLLFVSFMLYKFVQKLYIFFFDLNGLHLLVSYSKGWVKRKAENYRMQAVFKVFVHLALTFLLVSSVPDWWLRKELRKMSIIMRGFELVTALFVCFCEFSGIYCLRVGF